jgi:glyoxylase-like metal-dependent hydrolase (beta-lactamase superfamily II)
MTALVAPGIRRVTVGPVNAYLVDGEDGVTLVDTGLVGMAGTILRAIAGAGRDPTDVRAILLTHAHLDHAGSAASLSGSTGARVWVHEADAAATRSGRSPMPGPESRWLAAAVTRMPSPGFAPVAGALTFADAAVLAGGLRAIHTPGHTPGQTAFHLATRGGVLFTGDALTNLVGIRLGLVNDDWPAARRSVRRLAELEFATVAFGHGPVISGPGVARVRRAIERLAR